MIPEHLKVNFYNFIVDTLKDMEARKNGSRRPWTNQEEEKLLLLRSCGARHKAIGEILNRSELAVKEKLREIKDRGLREKNPQTSKTSLPPLHR